MKSEKVITSQDVGELSEKVFDAVDQYLKLKGIDSRISTMVSNATLLGALISGVEVPPCTTREIEISANYEQLHKDLVWLSGLNSVTA